MYRKNTAGQFIGFQLNSTATGNGVTGAAVTVKLSIDGTAYVTGTGTVTERTGGGYTYALSQADTNGNDISIQFSATGAITVEKTFLTTVNNPTVAGVTLSAAGLDNIVIEAGLNARQAISIIAAAVAGGSSGVDTGSPAVYQGAGVATTRITTTCASGNRSTVTLAPPA